MESAVTSGIGRLEGDTITLAKAEEDSLASQTPADDQAGKTTQEQDSEGSGDALAGAGTLPNEGAGDERSDGSGKQVKPTVILNLNVDPSSDPDKLEKQLRLLRQFRII